MPRYFFHLSFGQRVVSDEDGFELPNRSAACTEALAVVRELTNPEVSGGSRRWASWFLEVADESGGFFRTPIGHPALEVVTREAPRAEPREAVWLTPRLPSDLPAKGRVADIVREMLARRQHTAELLQANNRLRLELSSICLGSEGARIRASRLVSLARAASGRY